MKKVIAFLVIPCLISLTFYAFKDGHRSLKLNPVKENGEEINTVIKNPLKFTQSLTYDTSGSIPCLSNWLDYRSNGQNPHGLWVFGDTVLIACDMTDSLHAQISTARRSYYTVSYNGGISWITPALSVSTTGNSYPDMDPLILNGARNVAMSGHQSGGNSGYIAVDLFLGGGVFNIYGCGGHDIFTMPTSPTTIVGGFESRTTDSLFSIKFDATNNTYSSKVLLALSSDGISANSRTYSAASLSGYAATAWWDPAAGDMWCRVSSDGGTTFAPKVHLLSSTQVVNGDPVCSWVAADIVFSPSNNVAMAISTLSPGFYAFANGSKIVFCSPAINGGNPVVIVDWHNAPSNCMLSDTVYYSNHYSSTLEQVGMTALSHPSLAYSSDGTYLFCVYSVIQKDTASYGFFFNDICESYSTNNGATWSAPVKLTQTSQVDEIYPIISRSGCTSSNIAVTWQSSECPGSYSFTNTSTPECRVHNIFKRFNPTSGSVFYIVSGTVRYSDNNQPVPRGFVKALSLNRTTMQIVTQDSTGIQSNGTYSLQHVPQDSIFIMAYADDENDFVPTYHDSTIFWRNAHIVYPTSNLTNINIGVFRVVGPIGQMHIGGNVFGSSMTLTGLSNAIVYSKIGNQFKRFGISGNTGSYLIDSLLQGSYQLTCDRIGFDGGIRNVSLNSTNQDTINFYLNSVISVEKTGTLLPSSYKLYQNFPNPFNPSTTIRFDLPKTANAKLVIYDILGREVIKLVNEKLNPGTYKVDWNASNYASGLYFYKLVAGDFVETKKLVLIK